MIFINKQFNKKLPSYLHFKYFQKIVPTFQHIALQFVFRGRTATPFRAYSWLGKGATFNVCDTIVGSEFERNLSIRKRRSNFVLVGLANVIIFNKKSGPACACSSQRDMHEHKGYSQTANERTEANIM